MNVAVSSTLQSFHISDPSAAHPEFSHVTKLRRGTYVQYAALYQSNKSRQIPLVLDASNENFVLDLARHPIDRHPAIVRYRGKHPWLHRAPRNSCIMQLPVGQLHFRDFQWQREVTSDSITLPIDPYAPFSE